MVQLLIIVGGAGDTKKLLSGMVDKKATRKFGKTLNGTTTNTKATKGFEGNCAVKTGPNYRLLLCRDGFPRLFRAPRGGPLRTVFPTNLKDGHGYGSMCLQPRTAADPGPQGRAAIPGHAFGEVWRLPFPLGAAADRPAVARKGGCRGSRPGNVSGSPPK